jgi:hypothetical protein
MDITHMVADFYSVTYSFLYEKHFLFIFERNLSDFKLV